jgi:unsaturated chondroitin disaccharide hydrolase
MWHLLTGALNRITGEEQCRNRTIGAANALFSRFNIDGGFITAWNGQGAKNWSIIDCLMNLPILYWASEIYDDDRFKRVAMAHADMAIMDHVRADGSVVHIVEHNREDGEVVKTYGGQGYEDGSSWSRGQAWGIYGFVISYMNTGEQRYLDAAKQISNYFISNVCDDWLPRVDFRSPEEPIYYDSTAGVIAACGFLELGKLLPQHEGGMYTNAAINLLKAMTEKFTNWEDDTQYIMGYGTGAYPQSEKLDPWHETAIIYGDYFFAEALLKLKGAEFFPWGTK